MIHPPRTLGERIAIDHVGPLPASTEGFKYILTIQDQLTKILTLIPVKSTQVVETPEALLENYIYIYGIPGEIIMDNATGFQSEIMKI